MKKFLLNIQKNKYYSQFIHHCISGFTLAEVLITLLIIGVVASIVIPSLIQDSQEAEFHTAFKKIYSDVDQATRRIMMDNGGSLKGLFSSYPEMRNLYLPYLNSTKICSNSVNDGCWSNSCTLLNGGVASMGTQPGFILSNGISLIFTYLDTNCESATYGAGLPKCGVIEFDVNGKKGPNVYGKDIYGVYLVKNGIMPRGGTYDGYHCDGSTGIGCAYKYLYQ